MTTHRSRELKDFVNTAEFIGGVFENWARGTYGVAYDGGVGEPAACRAIGERMAELQKALSGADDGTLDALAAHTGFDDYRRGLFRRFLSEDFPRVDWVDECTAGMDE